jgi:hypothetical protein
VQRVCQVVAKRRLAVAVALGRDQLERLADELRMRPGRDRPAPGGRRGAEGERPCRWRSAGSHSPRRSWTVYELGMTLGGHGKEGQHWSHTLRALADHLGAEGEVTMQSVCVDRGR